MTRAAGMNTATAPSAAAGGAGSNPATGGGKQGGDWGAQVAPMFAGTRGLVTADQAIFTSNCSPLGNGYRIVSATPSISAAERAEITRRSPSHGSLCAEEGVATYRLGSGRQVITYSRAAGKEPRGGDRIYTHLLILSSSDYARFRYDPASVLLSATQLADDPVLDWPPSLPKIELAVADNHPEPPDAGELSAICGAVAGVIDGRTAILLWADPTLDAMQTSLLLAPPCVRRAMSASAGLTWAPSRPVDLAWVADDQGAIRRATSGHEVSLFDRDGCDVAGLRLAGWFGLIQRWHREGRWSEVVELTLGLGEDVQVNDLERLARICDDADTVPTSSPEQLSTLVAKYHHVSAGSATEARLVGKLLAAAAERQR